jgi:hypothetical protein
MVWFWSTGKYYWQFFCSFIASNRLAENAFLTSTFTLGEFGRCFGNGGMVRLWYSSSEDTKKQWELSLRVSSKVNDTDGKQTVLEMMLQCARKDVATGFISGNLAQNTVHSQGLFLPPFMLHCNCFILWQCYDIEFHGAALGMLVLSLFWTCQCFSWFEYDWKGLIHVEILARANGHCWVCCQQFLTIPLKVLMQSSIVWCRWILSLRNSFLWVMVSILPLPRASNQVVHLSP